MKTLFLIIVSILLCILILFTTKVDSEHVPCVPIYSDKYVKLINKPLPSEPQTPDQPLISYERFYDEHMLKHLDSVLFDESKYRLVMKETDNNVLL